jgi:hypothetical protein
MRTHHPTASPFHPIQKRLTARFGTSAKILQGCILIHTLSFPTILCIGIKRDRAVGVDDEDANVVRFGRFCQDLAHCAHIHIPLLQTPQLVLIVATNRR